MRQTVLSRRMMMAAGFGAFISPGTISLAREPKEMVIQKLAWAGIRVQAGNTDVFIDATRPGGDEEGKPLASSRKRAFALATHHHGDHLDIDALQPVLKESGYLVLPTEIAALIDARNIKMQTVGHYEPVFFSRSSGDLVAWCVPAVDGFGDPQVSWIVDSGTHRIIHCGDTLWHGSWWQIARAFGPFDAAFLPINGARQVGGMITNVGQSMVMTPEEAAQAAAALGAKLTVPIHYGFSATDYIEEPDAEARFIKEAKGLNVDVKIMEPGEVIRLN